MSAVIDKYFIIYASHKLLPDSLSNLSGEPPFRVDTAASAEALAKLAEKKMPVAIFLLQNEGKDPVDIVNKLRTNVLVDTVPIFVVNSLQDACRKMMEFVNPKS